MFSKSSKAAGSLPATVDTPRSTPAGRGSAVPSIISADLLIEGTLRSSGDIQVDGRVVGDIESRSVTIGQGAELQGQVVCETIRVNGRVSGEIRAKSVVISKSAEIFGDVIHESLAVEAGAQIEGSLRRLGAETSGEIAAPEEQAWAEGDAEVVEAEPVEATPAARKR
ncbi:MAG: polymer-forming cytoskeletal protein [Pseudomonadota bacterium]